MKKDYQTQIKEFSLGLAVILCVIGILVPFIKKQQHIHFWALYAAVFVLVIRCFKPMWLAPVYKIFLKITHFIGKINTAILLGIIFYLIITPIGFIIKLTKSKNFAKGFNKSVDTYWVRRDVELADPKRMEKQF